MPKEVEARVGVRLAVIGNDGSFFPGFDNMDEALGELRDLEKKFKYVGKIIELNQNEIQDKL